MIGLDTNVLVRYLAQDDPRQSAAATRFIETQLDAASPGFIAVVTLVELVWVLQRLYAATPGEVLDTVDDLLSASSFRVQQREAVQAAVASCRAAKGLGFADALIAHMGAEAGCSHTVTFDKGAVRGAAMRLLA